jgi:hypothetical protein
MLRCLNYLVPIADKEPMTANQKAPASKQAHTNGNHTAANGNQPAAKRKGRAKPGQRVPSPRVDWSEGTPESVQTALLSAIACNCWVTISYASGEMFGPSKLTVDEYGHLRRAGRKLRNGTEVRNGDRVVDAHIAEIALGWDTRHVVYPQPAAMSLGRARNSKQASTTNGRVVARA